MEKNRFKQLLESTMGDVRPLLSESEDSNDFALTSETTTDELITYLDEKVERRSGYGMAHTFPYIIQELVQNILVTSGKSEQESESMAEKFVKDNMTNSDISVSDPYSEYGYTLEGESTYKGKTIFEFSAGGDGYGYGGSLFDLNELLNDLKNLIQ